MEVADGGAGVDELVEAGAVVVGELHVEHGQGIGELLHGAGPMIGEVMPG